MSHCNCIALQMLHAASWSWRCNHQDVIYYEVNHVLPSHSFRRTEIITFSKWYNEQKWNAPRPKQPKESKHAKEPNERDVCMAFERKLIKRIVFIARILFFISISCSRFFCCCLLAFIANALNCKRHRNGAPLSFFFCVVIWFTIFSMGWIHSGMLNELLAVKLS